MAGTTILILVIGAVLIIGALFLFSSTKEDDASPKTDNTKGIVLEPKLSEEDLKAFSRQHKLVSHPFPVVKYIVIIGLVVIAFPFIKSTFFKGKSFFPTTNKMLTHGMSQEQYQEICLGTLKPAMTEHMSGIFMKAFAGDETSGEDIHDEWTAMLEGIAKEYGLPCANSVLNLCAAAEQQHNPNGEDRLFKQKTPQKHHPVPLVQSVP